jgi:DNA-3-methyladenine glycosylase
VSAVELCRGPGNLTRALGITLDQNRLDLCAAPRKRALYIEDRGLGIDRVAWGPRIGIRVAADRPWRCWIEGNPSVSATPRRA